VSNPTPTTSTHPIRALLVDDEALARARLRTLLADCREPLAVVAGEASGAVRAMEWLQHHACDVVLLDIHMPGADGLALAQAMQTLAQAPAVIFVTAHTEHALRAFDLAALDYLTKPVRLERLQEALQKVERARQYTRGLQADLPQEEVIIIVERGGTERVPVQQVVYFKAELKYVTVRTTIRSYVVDDTLNELEAQYGERFLRIHRNALIARSAVRSLQKQVDAVEGEGWAVRLSGVDELLAVSRRQLAAVRALVKG